MRIFILLAVFVFASLFSYGQKFAPCFSSVGLKENFTVRLSFFGRDHTKGFAHYAGQRDSMRIVLAESKLSGGASSRSNPKVRLTYTEFYAMGLSGKYIFEIEAEKITNAVFIRYSDRKKFKLKVCPTP